MKIVRVKRTAIIIMLDSCYNYSFGEKKKQKTTGT